MDSSEKTLALLDTIIDRVNVGIVVVDSNNRVVLWNRFMASYSENTAENVIGQSIFDACPYLPEKWLQQKIKNVFVLKNFSFTSWDNRPFLFRFQHNHPITGNTDPMRQSCTFMPIKTDSDSVEYVCILVNDMTEFSESETQLKKTVAILENLSTRDTLTSAFNRRHLTNALNKEFSRVKRYEGNLSVILLDIDFFKKINDQHGHKAGDDVLKKVASLMNSTIREADICGRYGGEEFLAILPETDLAGAMTLAERLRKTIAENEYRSDNVVIQATASIGVASYSPNNESYEQLVHNADVALYASKQNGRNKVSPFTENEITNKAQINEPDEQSKHIIHHVKVGYRI